VSQATQIYSRAGKLEMMLEHLSRRFSRLSHADAMRLDVTCKRREQADRMMGVANLPDFAVRLVALYLWSEDVARLMRASFAEYDVLGAREFLLWLLAARSGLEAASLAQLHVAEAMREWGNVVEFSSLSSTLRHESLTFLRSVAYLLMLHPRADVLVEGHGQPGLPTAMAEQVSKMRANVVVQELERFGVARKRMKAVAYATYRPQQPLATADVISNRRAEIFVRFDGGVYPRPSQTHQGMETASVPVWEMFEDDEELVLLQGAGCSLWIQPRHVEPPTAASSCSVHLQDAWAWTRALFQGCMAKPTSA